MISTGVGAEAHDIVDHVSRLERQPQVRQPFGNRVVGQAFLAQPLGEPSTKPDGHELAQAFLERLHADAAIVFQGDAQDRLFRAAGPQIHGVDGVGRRRDAAEAHGNILVVGADLFFDNLQGLGGHFLGSLNANSGGAADPQLELAGVHEGENLGAELPAAQPDHEHGQGQIAGDERHAPGKHYF